MINGKRRTQSGSPETVAGNQFPAIIVGKTGTSLMNVEERGRITVGETMEPHV